MSTVEKEMRQYNNMHIINSTRAYENDEESYVDGYADYIGDNFDRLTDDQKAKLLTRCLGIKKINKELLKYELYKLENKPVPEMSLKDAISQARKILQRYQGKVGGYDIEDSYWTSYKPGKQMKYHIKENQYLLENSVAKGCQSDREFNKFINRIVHRLNGLAENIRVKFKSVESKKDSIVWIALVFTDNSLKVRKIEL